MRKMLFLFFLLFCVSNVFGADWTIESNPDGKIGAPVFILGGSFGSGSLKDNYESIHESEKFNTSSFSLLGRLEYPASKKGTWILQIEYLRDRVGTSGIYEGITSGYRVSMYWKIFSK